MKHKVKVLLIDTDEEVISKLTELLKQENYSVISSSGSKEAIEIALKELPNLIIMEILLPEMDGIELCMELRLLEEMDKTLIAFYSSRNDDYSQIAALNAGADDYIVKPVKPRVLIKRINAILKRQRIYEEFEEIVNDNGLRINKEEYMVYRGDEKIFLPRKEFELLYLLSQSPQKIVTREEISKEIWGYEMATENRTLDVHVRKIRKKLGGDYIKTIRGVGYILNVELPIEK